jgi:hypothetical protein
MCQIQVFSCEELDHYLIGRLDDEYVSPLTACLKPNNIAPSKTCKIKIQEKEYDCFSIHNYTLKKTDPANLHTINFETKAVTKARLMSGLSLDQMILISSFSIDTSTCIGNYEVVNENGSFRTLIKEIIFCINDAGDVIHECLPGKTLPECKALEREIEKKLYEVVLRNRKIREEMKKNQKTELKVNNSPRDSSQKEGKPNTLLPKGVKVEKT